jgi:hypothetical protein
MTRVDDNYEAQRLAEERRAQELQQKKQVEAKREFQRVVTQQQKVAKTTAQKNTADAQKRGSASQALLARQGIQSRGFTESLQKRGDAAVQHTRDEHLGRRADIDAKKERVEEKRHKGDLERLERLERGESEDKRGAPVSLDDERENKGSGGHGEEAGMSFGQPQSGMSSELHASSNTPQAGAGARLPQNLIYTLVERVFAGVTPEGLSQFTVELKDGVLGGARLDVVANGGKIRCTFHTPDKNIGRLVKASEGMLAKAFSAKGLVLERLDVP